MFGQSAARPRRGDAVGPRRPAVTYGDQEAQNIAQQRRRSRLKRVPVLVATSLIDPKIHAEATALGISGFLLKTAFSMDELLDTVADCLGRASIPDLPRPRRSTKPSQKAPPRGSDQS